MSVNRHVQHTPVPNAILRKKRTSTPYDCGTFFAAQHAHNAPVVGARELEQTRSRKTGKRQEQDERCYGVFLEASEAKLSNHQGRDSTHGAPQGEDRQVWNQGV